MVYIIIYILLYIIYIINNIPDNGALFSTKKKWAIKLWKDMEETKMPITNWKKPIWKCCILYDSNYMIFWKRQNHEDKGQGWEGRDE